MARYKTQEFGELESVWKKVPDGGILLREDDGVVLLEQHFNDTYGKRVDVLFQFEEGITLADKVDFSECLKEARKFEPDSGVPIYIQVPSERENEEEVDEEARRAIFQRLIQRSGTHPWNFYDK